MAKLHLAGHVQDSRDKLEHRNGIAIMRKDTPDEEIQKDRRQNLCLRFCRELGYERCTFIP